MRPYCAAAGAGVLRPREWRAPCSARKLPLTTDLHQPAPQAREEEGAEAPSSSNTFDYPIALRPKGGVCASRMACMATLSPADGAASCLFRHSPLKNTTVTKLHRRGLIIRGIYVSPGLRVSVPVPLPRRANNSQGRQHGRPWHRTHTSDFRRTLQHKIFVYVFDLGGKYSCVATHPACTTGALDGDTRPHCNQARCGRARASLVP